MLVLTASDVRRALPMRAAIDSQKQAFAALATGDAALPHRTAVPVAAQNAVSFFMPARVGHDLGAKIVSVFPDNPARGLPMIHGVVILIDSDTGRPLALMDATYLTALRTGAGAGAATELLARPDSAIAAIIGAGAQARTQLLAVCEARPIRRAYVYSRSADHVHSFIADMQPMVTGELVAASSPAEAVSQADVICAATTSTIPVFDGNSLKPGAHVNGVGSYRLDMVEVDAETVRRAGRVFVDTRDSALAEAGDLAGPLRDGLIAQTDLIEIGLVASGRHPGRASTDEVTFFKSCGVAVQDVSAGGAVLRRAREFGLGTEINL